jgi:hypothetical protein
MRGAIPHSPNTPSWLCAQLKHRSNFTFTFTLVVYGMITNDVSDYINLLARIAHIICNHPILRSYISNE